MANNYLVIPDTHEPFGLKHAPRFCLAVAKEFKIPRENVIQLGDTTDDYFGSRFPKDPDGYHSANSEIAAALDKLQAWYRAFPQAKVCISNHNLRWAKKAFEAEIPSQMLKPYRDLIEAPTGWKWAYSWTIPTKHRWRAIHGLGYGGINGHRTAAMDGGISTVIGHLHSHAGIAHITTDGQKVWGMNAGCLIDVEAYVFSYGKESRFKPTLGVGVVIDNGKTPVWIPWER